MIDLHHHCLPGVDDGPSSWDDSVALCRRAAEHGIETIVATPHVFRGSWINDDRRELQKLTLELNRRLAGTPSVILGSEYYFSHDILDLLDQESGIVPLAGTRHVLIEFPSMSVPPRVDTVFHEMTLRGWIPIVAHPERNVVFQENLERLAALILVGAQVQLTAMSLDGLFGPDSKHTSFELLDREMVHFIATDAHNLGRRPPEIARAMSIVSKRWGVERANLLFNDNPKAVIEQLGLPYDPQPRPAPDSGLRRLFGRLFSG